MEHSNNNSVSEDASVRKEILEHIRNIQKAEEISAKRSGINIWVLWGALWFVVWKLLEIKLRLNEPTVLDISLSLILVSQSFYLMVSPTPQEAADTKPRFINLNIFGLSETPYLTLLLEVWGIAPAIAFWVIIGASFLSVLFGVYHILSLTTLLGSALLMNKKFSKLFFNHYPRALGAIIDFLFFVGCITGVIHIVHLAANLDVFAWQSCVLLLTFFWLIRLLIASHQESFGVTWTYRTERDLLLGIINNSDALQRIEQRYLGKTLSEELDLYWREVEEIQSKVSVLLDDFDKLIKEYNIKQKISSNEPDAQYLRFDNSIQNELNKLGNIQNEFADYLRRLQASQLVIKNKNIIAAIQSAQKRHVDSLAATATLVAIFEGCKQNSSECSPDAA